MADIIINGMEMPKGCYSCHIGVHIGLYAVQCPITKSKIDGFTEYIRLSDCPLRPAPEWISVEDRLPESDADVLVHAGLLFPYIEAGYYDGLWKYSYDGTEIEGVTHWMPLPEPPCGGDGNG